MAIHSHSVHSFDFASKTKKIPFKSLYSLDKKSLFSYVGFFLPKYSIEETTKYKVYSSSSFLKLSPLTFHSQLLSVYINTQVLAILKNKTINKLTNNPSLNLCFLNLLSWLPPC